MKTFDDTNDILIYYSVRRGLAVKTLFFCCEVLIASAFYGMNRVSMDLFDPQVTGVGFYDGSGLGPDAGFLEESEIMPFATGKRGADDLLRIPIHNKLSLYRVPLFLPGIPLPLPLFGRSIGVSVASISITSNSISLFNKAFRPGNENVPSSINVFSTHLMV